MFDIGFLEILVILIIALLVIGPERMPEVARKMGGFMGKMKRFINSVKEEGQVQETIKDFKESMNLEQEQDQIASLNKELQSGLNFESDTNLDAFKRPTFGGAEQPIDSTQSSGQFNRAPSQPVAPKPVESENAQPSMVEETPSEAIEVKPQPVETVSETPSEPSETKKS